MLDQLVERMAAADSFEEYRRADMRFHIGVAEAAHSPRLVTAMTEVQGNMSELITRIAHPEEVLTRSNGQHRRLASPRRGEAGPAVRLMREHRGDRAHPGGSDLSPDSLALRVEQRLPRDLALDPTSEDLYLNGAARLGVLRRQVPYAIERSTV